MPIYDVECRECGKTDQVITMDVNKAMPECCGKEMIKLISPPAVTRVAGPTGVIVDERQVYDSHGKNWRDRENKNPFREGGARKRIYSR
jgi:predicted nucleic acid-binding Zn ribbon protein